MSQRRRRKHWSVRERGCMTNKRIYFEQPFRKKNNRW